MAKIGIMIEGQEDLTWERLLRLADAVESLGFDSLYRSDHLTGLAGHPKRVSLDLWSSLTALALRTKRIRFGPLVCPMTFRHPAMLAKEAAAVEVLSGGRLDLGIGAGWNEFEHRMFGIPYPNYKTRVEMLEEGAQVILALWSGAVTTLEGQHYCLREAESYPLPTRPKSLIIGGKGEKYTLRIVARYATEWNCTYIGVEGFRNKSRILDEHCAAAGRDPRDIKRSLMIPFAIGENSSAIQRHIDAQRQTFPGLPQTLEAWRKAGFIGGEPPDVVAQLKAFEAVGVSRFMLQQNALDDIDSLRLLAENVLPHVDS